MDRPGPRRRQPRLSSWRCSIARRGFEPLAFDHFWLSDTPEVIGSNTWGTKHRRMVTWVKFLDRQTQQEFFLWNTHFDNDIQIAREKSAKLVRERVAALDTKLPLILTGDFNAAAGTNQAYQILTGDGFFADTWMTAKERKGEGLNTSNGFQAIRRNGVRIDWILTRGAFTVDSAEIVTFSRERPVSQRPFPGRRAAADGRGQSDDAEAADGQRGRI